MNNRYRVDVQLRLRATAAVDAPTAAITQIMLLVVPCQHWKGKLTEHICVRNGHPIAVLGGKIFGLTCEFVPHQHRHYFSVRKK